MRPPRTFVFAGGGTGGHIFPAIAISESLHEIDPSTECFWVCSDRPLDAEILRGESFAGQPARFESIPAKPFGLSPRTLYRFVESWGMAVRAGRAILKQRVAEGRAVTLVAMGGFVAAPMAQAARVEGIPIVLVNLDAVPGRANRWIARRATKVFTSTRLAPHLASHSKGSGRGKAWIQVPPIVRRKALATESVAGCRKAVGLDPSRPVLFVTGASQGAGTINEFMSRFVETHSEAFRNGGWQVIHQTGKGDPSPLREAYAKAGISAVVDAFFSNMGQAWKASVLAVSRAGAGNVAEAWANQVPTVFMPYPYHRDEHQRYNASLLEEAGGALVPKDEIEVEANMRGAGLLLKQLLESPTKVAEMRRAIVGLGPVDGGRQIADHMSNPLSA